MSRPSTGTVDWRPNPNKPGTSCWQARYTRADKTRTPWYVLDENIAQDDEAGARAFALEFAAIAKATTKDGTGESVSAYSIRWLGQRSPQSRRDYGQQLKTHVLPIIGHVSILSLSAAHGDRLVASLDTKIAAGTMADKSARNVWGTIKKMLRDAAHAKPSTGLRCLSENPFRDVMPPERSKVRKSRQFLYPSEYLALVRHPDVPLAFKRNVSIAVFLGLRYSEQKALRWEHVDLEHGIVNVCEVFDTITKETREGTKTGQARTVPIHPALIPMLTHMNTAADGTGLVCPDLYAREATARSLRRWLERAGVDRTSLLKASAVGSRLRWHDLRATCATWHAVAGCSALEIRDVMGHTNTAMTDKYMRNAQAVRGGNFGDPFPALPVSSFKRHDGISQHETNVVSTTYEVVTEERSRSRERPRPDLRPRAHR